MIAEALVSVLLYGQGGTQPASNPLQPPKLKSDIAIEIGQSKVPDKMPQWLAIYTIDTGNLNQEALSKAESALCGNQKWKILIGRQPIYSNGIGGDSRAAKKTLEPLIEKCNVHLYVSAGDCHQEHITAENYEIIIQGAVKKSCGVDQKMYKPGDQTKQRFARQQVGFALLEIRPEKIALRFYDQKASEIYHWSAGANEIGLAQTVPTRPSSEQTISSFGID